MHHWPNRGVATHAAAFVMFFCPHGFASAFMTSSCFVVPYISFAAYPHFFLSSKKLGVAALICRYVLGAFIYLSYLCVGFSEPFPRYICTPPQMKKMRRQHARGNISVPRAYGIRQIYIPVDIAPDISPQHFPRTFSFALLTSSSCVFVLLKSVAPEALIF